MDTLTDTDRLDFMLAHSATAVLHPDDTWEVWVSTPNILGSQAKPCLPLPRAYYKDPRHAINACIRVWNDRLGDIAAGRVHPSKEVHRFADAQNPGGIKP